MSETIESNRLDFLFELHSLGIELDNARKFKLCKAGYIEDDKIYAGNGYSKKAYRTYKNVSTKRNYEIKHSNEIYADKYILKLDNSKLDTNILNTNIPDN